MRILTILTAVAALISTAGAAEKKLQMKDLPPAVQKTVQDQTKGAEIKGITKETEKGKTSYEVETMVNGKHRDFTVDAGGALGAVEEETTLEAVPAAARAAFQKKVGSGTVVMVETVSAGGTISYEITYKDKGGKSHEYAVKADGTEIKD